MKKKVLIFDMDGVIIDSIAFAYESLKRQYPDMTNEIHREIVCGNYHEEIQNITLQKIEQTEEEKLKHREWYADFKSQSPFYEGAIDLLKHLHATGYVLVLNTSANDRNCLPILNKAEITALFDFVATAEISKSKVEKFKMIEEKYGVRAEDMVFVTDTLGDVREADVAGVPTVAVTWGMHDESYFKRELHDNLIQIVHTMKELEDFIKVRFN